MTLRLPLYIAGLLLALQAVVLWGLGQPLIAASGQVLLWVSEPLSPDNSQHLADWYTLSHIVHGIIFFWLAGKFFPQLSMGMRFLLAVGVEVGWEIIENTPLVIEHYRQQALAQGYIGDSIINSLMDTLAMVGGFFAARRLPVWASIAAIVLLEAAALLAIRDSLVLNILGFFHQFEFIQQWQSN
jgi:hypothetical protein